MNTNDARHNAAVLAKLDRIIELLEGAASQRDQQLIVNAVVHGMTSEDALDIVGIKQSL